MNGVPIAKEKAAYFWDVGAKSVVVRVGKTTPTLTGPASSAGGGEHESLCN
jgi:hypothetical protein